MQEGGGTTGSKGTSTSRFSISNNNKHPGGARSQDQLHGLPLFIYLNQMQCFLAIILLSVLSKCNLPIYQQHFRFAILQITNITLENNVGPEKAIMYKALCRQNTKNASQEQFTNQISL